MKDKSTSKIKIDENRIPIIFVWKRHGTNYGKCLFAKHKYSKMTTGVLHLNTSFLSFSVLYPCVNAKDKFKKKNSNLKKV